MYNKIIIACNIQHLIPVIKNTVYFNSEIITFFLREFKTRLINNYPARFDCRSLLQFKTFNFVFLRVHIKCNNADFLVQVFTLKIHFNDSLKYEKLVLLHICKFLVVCFWRGRPA